MHRRLLIQLRADSPIKSIGRFLFSEMAAQGIGLAVGVRGGVVVLAVKQTSNTPDFIIKSLLINAIILQAHYMLRISVINQYRFIFSLIVQLFFQIFDLTFDE